VQNLIIVVTLPTRLNRMRRPRKEVGEDRLIFQQESAILDSIEINLQHVRMLINNTFPTSL
jgi:hypothetical protein